MKAKKALRRLSEVETLLTGVIDRYPGSKGDLRELLNTAKKSIVRAKKTVNVDAAPPVSKKPVSKAESPELEPSTEGRKKISAPAKTRAAVA